MILAGRVQVNGEVRSTMPVMIEPDDDVVSVDGKAVAGGMKEQPLVYYLLNKPKGILVTNYDPADRKLVSELTTGIKERVFPVGRLDMDARGLLVLTNDGDLANRLTHPRHGVEKTYIVEVDGRLNHGDLEKMKTGLWLGPERPGALGGAEKSERFRVKLVGRERGRTILEVKVSEGKNREIRRVMARLGHPVRDLNRVALAGKVTIRGLEVGKYRPLTPEEVKWLFHASSPEFHIKQRSATQSWYEAKETEKERRRLDREAEEPGKPARPGLSKPAAGKDRFPARPAKATDRFPRRTPRLPGPRRANERLVGRAVSDKPVSPVPLGKPMKKTMRHPLGDQAGTDE